MNFTESCSYYSVVFNSTTCEDHSLYSSNKEVGLEVSGYSDCYVVWKITTSESGNDQYCTAKIYFKGNWFNDEYIQVRIKVLNTTTTTSTGTGTTQQPAQQQTEEEEEEENISLSFYEAPSYVFVEQNSTNTTTVKVNNLGTIEANVYLEIKGINSSWWLSNG